MRSFDRKRAGRKSTRATLRSKGYGKNSSVDGATDDRKRKVRRGASDDPSKIEYLDEVKQLKDSIEIWDNFFGANEDEQGYGWARLDVIGQSLLRQYAWAIPDERALRILANYAPLVEIGCGLGYWAHLLRVRGVDILAADKYSRPTLYRPAHTEVIRAGPEILRVSRGRNLFLCYPDEKEAMSIEAFKWFEGEYIIHCGELVTTGATLSGKCSCPSVRVCGWSGLLGVLFMTGCAPTISKM
jgi:hypothetical protein